MSRSQPAALRVQSLRVARGARCLFTGLEFELAAGQIALVTGANGSGKTSLLRVVAGLAPPTAGRATWRDRDVGRIPPALRGDIAYQGHLDGLKKDLTARENLDFYRRLWGGAAIHEGLLGELRLEAVADLPLRYLSAGQRRRVGLGTLKLRAAELWILDEPATGLDTDGRALVASWLQAHLAQGGLAVVATHQPAELARSGALLIEL